METLRARSYELLNRLGLITGLSRGAAAAVVVGGVVYMLKPGFAFDRTSKVPKPFGTAQGQTIFTWWSLALVAGFAASTFL